MAKFITSLASLTIGNYDHYSPPPTPTHTIGGFSETVVGLHVGGWVSTLPLNTATTTTSLALVYAVVQFYPWFNFYFSLFFFM